MRICIDSGHNYDKFDTGAVGNGLKEQNVTFEIGEKLKKLLEKRGIEVVMTRGRLTCNIGKNANDSIKERAKLANNQRCDYFISIHCNSHTNKSANGTETLVYGLGGKAEELANKVNKSIVYALGTYGRGIKVRPDLGVLRLTDMPAILIETAFISNEKDAELLKNKKDVFAEAIAKGIFEHIGIKDKQMTVDEAVTLIKTKAGLEGKTMEYLLGYKYGKDLVIKLAKAMDREG